MLVYNTSSREESKSGRNKTWISTDDFENRKPMSSRVSVKALKQHHSDGMENEELGNKV